MLAGPVLPVPGDLWAPGRDATPGADRGRLQIHVPSGLEKCNHHRKETSCVIKAHSCSRFGQNNNNSNTHTTHTHTHTHICMCMYIAFTCAFGYIYTIIWIFTAVFTDVSPGSHSIPLSEVKPQSFSVHKILKLERPFYRWTNRRHIDAP